MGGTFKTAFLLTLLTLGFIYIGNLLGGQFGMTIALVFALIMNVGAYWYSDKLVLSMYRAKEVTPDQAPEIYSIVESVAARASIPTPKVYAIPHDTPNAFATGRNPENAVVAVTHGITQILDRDELEGVIAHEIGHIKNRDILIGTVAATLAGAIGYISHMAGWAMMFGGLGGSSNDDHRGGGLGALVMIILAPIMALLIQMAISRSREYRADETAANLTGRPLSLASALKKISYGAERIPLEANPATAHMFIMNPLKGRISGLFSTHPPVSERIARLDKLAYQINP